MFLKRSQLISFFPKFTVLIFLRNYALVRRLRFKGLIFGMESRPVLVLVAVGSNTAGDKSSEQKLVLKNLAPIFFFFKLLGRIFPSKKIEYKQTYVMSQWSKVRRYLTIV